MPSETDVEHTILRLVDERGAGKSICPSEAARALDPSPTFHKLMPTIRRIAVRLAVEGRLTILRKGKPVDPLDFKGVYRLALQPTRESIIPSD